MNIGLQRRTDLALSILRVLHEVGGRLSGAELARQVDTTSAYLPQVAAPLIRAGWVRSERGPGGGYSLTPKAAESTLLDVLRATQGQGEDGRCVLKDKPCPGEHPCPVHAVWMEARLVLIEGFGMMPAIDKGAKQ